MTNVVWGFPNPQATVLEPEYQYKEIDISSAELINPPFDPLYSMNGFTLLPESPVGQYYEWKANIEFIPGSVPYTIGGSQLMQCNANTVNYPDMDLNDIGTQNLPSVFLIDSRVFAIPPIFNLRPINPGEGFAKTFLKIDPGVFTVGNGTIKVKIWYKVVKFG